MSPVTITTSPLSLRVDFVKYEIGDFVSKPVIGICKIENILYLNPQDEKNDKLYYLMKPVEDEKDKIYVPVSSSDSRLRLCLTKEEAWNLIKRIPDIPTAWTNNEKMREQNYKEAVRANNPEALVAIIKMIFCYLEIPCICSSTFFPLCKSFLLPLINHFYNSN